MDSETSPLLNDNQQRAETGANHGRANSDNTPQANLPACPSPRPSVVILLVAFIIFTQSTSGALAAVPLTRLLEDAICRRYYSNRSDKVPIDEGRCKVDEVQSDLAYLNGFLSALEAVVGLLVALPYGVLADKIGRKPVMVLGAVGSFLSFLWVLLVLRLEPHIPVHALLVSPAFLVVGGGNGAILAAFYATISDVVSEVDRASAFFFISFSALMGPFVGPVLSSFLMQRTSPWAPLLLTAAIALLGLGVIAFIPETLVPPKETEDDDDDDDDEQEGEENPPANANGNISSTIATHLRSSLSRLANSVKMLKSWSLALVLSTFTIQDMELVATSQFFVQYISKRFDWSLAEAGYLLSIRGTINIVLLLVVLPGLSRLLVSSASPLQLSPARRDLVLARASALFFAVGAVLLAGPSVSLAIAGLALNTLGSGLSSLCRSLATTYVDAQHTTALYSLISIADVVGSLYAGPALAWLFQTGMRLGGLWLGLPYVGLAVMLALAAVALVFVRVSSGAWGQVEAVGGED
ncbi:major facilitator superfamily domain-containing protein [Cercophora newfieldiana]|uniref:Major facilitator superfamily domain-containing protein n=1 Tax=Cercophora newfieldiana TaxID=92897 RepID=A0AA39Y3L8_9PEZI|nr:major facilitator superfamily domain-containing protein [Cercophora newfieldiana]